MIKVFKCDNLCTVSDREVKCDRCGENTKFLCEVETDEERRLLVSNLQREKFKKVIKNK